MRLHKDFDLMGRSLEVSTINVHTFVCKKREFAIAAPVAAVEQIFFSEKERKLFHEKAHFCKKMLLLFAIASVFDRCRDAKLQTIKHTRRAIF